MMWRGNYYVFGNVWGLGLVLLALVVTRLAFGAALVSGVFAPMIQTRPPVIAALCVLALSACAAPEPVTVWECTVYGINNVNPEPKDNKL